MARSWHGAGRVLISNEEPLGCLGLGPVWKSQKLEEKAESWLMTLPWSYADAVRSPGKKRPSAEQQSPPQQQQQAPQEPKGNARRRENHNHTLLLTYLLLSTNLTLLLSASISVLSSHPLSLPGERSTARNSALHPFLYSFYRLSSSSNPFIRSLA